MFISNTNLPLFEDNNYWEFVHGEKIADYYRFEGLFWRYCALWLLDYTWRFMKNLTTLTFGSLGGVKLPAYSHESLFIPTLFTINIVHLGIIYWKYYS
jgi:hypothetical protein